MMSQKNKIIILISNTGTGTNTKAIISGVKKGRINALVVAVISDKIDALGLKYARNNNTKIEICEKKENLLQLLNKLNPDYIALAGWKQIILDEVINAFPDKILNLHPGLIPNTINGEIKNPDNTQALWNKGMLAEKAIGNFLDKKSTYAGSSIHYLTLEFDFGPVLGRVFEKIEENDNIKSLYTKLKKKENELYVEVLEKLTNESR